MSLGGHSEAEIGKPQKEIHFSPRKIPTPASKPNNRNCETIHLSRFWHFWQTSQGFRLRLALPNFCYEYIIE
ncbi:hypothetical protein L8106_16259 [Lyngbya sp. PCC 8106]|nr:hypothetical protein L8106_16259 [Lyngbya sp. PCC 8106]